MRSRFTLRHSHPETALKQIKQEVLKVERGEWPKEDNPLVNAPHTAADVTGEWAHPYSREEAVFPLPFVRETNSGRASNG